MAKAKKQQAEAKQTERATGAADELPVRGGASRPRRRNPKLRQGLISLEMPLGARSPKPQTPPKRGKQPSARRIPRAWNRRPDEPAGTSPKDPKEAGVRRRPRGSVLH